MMSCCKHKSISAKCNEQQVPDCHVDCETCVWALLEDWQQVNIDVVEHISDSWLCANMCAAMPSSA
jgi:hypothetical protein